MKIAALICRYLMGLIFLVFGLNGFLHFLHMPPPSSASAGHFFAATGPTGYMSFVFFVQVVGGALLLAGIYVPFALLILGPVIVNILLFHTTMAPEGLPLALVTALLWIVVVARYWRAFSMLVTNYKPV